MTTFQDLTNEVLQTLNGYGLSQPRAAFLNAAIGATDRTIPVSDASDFSQGVAELGDEVVFVETVDTAANVLTVSPDGRGYYGTTAAAHDKDTRIESAATWPRHSIRSALNDTIVNTYPTIFGVASTTFTYNGSQTAYPMPAEAEAVLSVTADVLGPTKDKQQVVRRYFDAFSKTLSLGESVAPGRTVTVVYAKVPSPLVNPTDDFTSSGLRLTAKPLVVLGACSQLLAYMDAARLPVDTARADEFDTRNAVGTATRISMQLLQRYELELEKERKRLRATTPVPINVRIR